MKRRNRFVRFNSMASAFLSIVALVSGGRDKPTTSATSTCSTHPTVMFVLDEIVRSGDPRPEDRGVMIALGPGMAAEVALLRW